jgi:hypothetical protein
VATVTVSGTAVGAAARALLSLAVTAGAGWVTAAGTVSGTFATVLSTGAAFRAVSAALPAGVECLAGGKILGVTTRMSAARMTKMMKRLSINRLLGQGTGS